MTPIAQRLADAGIDYTRGPHFAENFAKHRGWLETPETRAEMDAILKGSNARTDWPVNIGELIDRHNAHATMCLEAAARHCREADRLSALQEVKP